jgi:hypothetical protein
MKKQVLLMLAVFGTVGGNMHRVQALEYLPASIVVDDSNGNVNGKLEPAESVSLSLSLLNSWADATNVQATLSCGDSLVRITKATASFADVLYGELTDNRADPFVVSLNGDCPGTYTLQFTLEVTAEGPDSYSATSYFNYAVMLNQQGYDDGEPDGHVEATRWVLYDTEIAIRITPEIRPCLLTHVRLFPCVDSNCTIVITVWDDNTPGGLPGTLLGTVKADIDPAASGDWFDVDISPMWVTIDEGSFYVRLSGNTKDAYHHEGIYRNGIDRDPPYYGMSWYYERYDNDWEFWYPFESSGLSANLMVRVRYASSTEDGPVENLISGKRYQYIQQALFEADDDDEIVVAKGLYNENINFRGKPLTVRSTDPADPEVVADTIINGKQRGPAVTFESGQSFSSTLRGFTIRGAALIRDDHADANKPPSIGSGGGAIACLDLVRPGPVIRECVIAGNDCPGLYCYDSSPLLFNCTLAGNDSNGIELPKRSVAKLTNCVIVGNNGYGVLGANPTLTNCTIVANVLAGIASFRPTLRNCILWDNASANEQGPQIIEDPSGRGWVNITYSNVKGGWEGEGNINIDPCFVSLQSLVPLVASNPKPHDRIINVDPNIILQWSAGRAATSHNVYFGTDLDRVSEATTDSNEFMGNEDSNSWNTSEYAPSGLTARTYYYWRVDEVNESYVDSPWKGRVWSFKTFDPNLVGWWQFNEGAGDVVSDSSAYGNHGTIVDATSIGSTCWVKGHGEGYALEFIGNEDAGDRVEVPDSNELRPKHQVTVSAWINYREPWSVHGHVVSKGANDRETFSLERGHGYDQMNFLVREDETYSQYRAWGFGLERDEWVHIAGVYDGAYLSSYINGEVQESYHTGPMTLSQNTVGLGIGNRPNDKDSPILGIVDDVRVYDRGFSESQMRQEYEHQVYNEEATVDYGGDYRLRPGSWCIDAGDNLAVPLDLTDLDGDGDTAEPVPWDLDENDRIVDGDNDGNAVADMGAYEYFVPPVEVAMKFTPQAFNPGSEGNWFKLHFVLPEGYDINDVDLNAPAQCKLMDTGEIIESDYVNAFLNEEELLEIEAGFERSAFALCLSQPAERTVTVTGLIEGTSGQNFYGTDTIKIINNTLQQIAALASYWLAQGCDSPDWCNGLDLNRDGTVNFADFALSEGCCIEIAAP